MDPVTIPIRQKAVRPNGMQNPILENQPRAKMGYGKVISILIIIIPRINFKALLMLGLCFVFGCSEPSSEDVIITIPDDFRGPVRILVEFSGAVIEPINGAYHYNIPKDGTLRVQDVNGFTKWHHTVAQTTVGRRISIDPERSPGTIALFHISSNSTGIYFFVGTEDEKKEALVADTIVPRQGKVVDLEFLRSLMTNP